MGSRAGSFIPRLLALRGLSVLILGGAWSPFVWYSLVNSQLAVHWTLNFFESGPQDASRDALEVTS